MALKLFPGTLINSYMLSYSVKHFVFKCEQNPPFYYEPGQFISIHFSRNDKNYKRSYSLANVPSTNNYIEFAAGFVTGGVASELLFNLKVGDQLQLSGPYGRLVLKETPPKRYILIATSTGATPYRAMLNKLVEQMKTNEQLNVVFLQGVQHRGDILYREDWINFLKTFPTRAIFRAYLSRETNPSEQELEYKGYVQTAFNELSLNPEEDLIYLCGNPGMIDDSFAELKERGFAVQQIIREKYISL